jgi:hypothetical protein
VGLETYRNVDVRQNGVGLGVVREGAAPIASTFSR